MRILFVSEERRYERIVKELRKKNHVDYLFIDTRWEVENGNYHIPKVLGRHIGYRFLATLVNYYLLLRNKYDFCITDYCSVFKPSVFCIIKNLTNMINTKFIHDIRTIPVGYPEYLGREVESKFSKQLRFVNRFYHGITLITEEMKKHIEQKYVHIRKPLCIWESGVDTSIFKPASKDIFLKRSLELRGDDFVCFYHGAIGDARGTLELVNSFAIIKAREKNIKLFMLGRGPGYKRMQHIINDLNLNDTVILHDWVEYHEVPRYISIADLCIVPLPDIDWWRVSSPLKLMEYISCGKNILLTDMVAHTNFLGRNTNYFWVHEVTAESLAKKIGEAYKCFRRNPVQFYEGGIKARQRLIGNISWERRAKILEEFFHSLKECTCRSLMQYKD